MAHEYIKENDTFSTSRNGTVPKPTSEEVSANKVLRADGRWVEQSGGSSVVSDVEVNGTSVVNEQGVAEIDLTGKQDVLTPGERISINDNNISATILPFVISGGKMCMTYEVEEE